MPAVLVGLCIAIGLAAAIELVYPGTLWAWARALLDDDVRDDDDDRMPPR